MLFNSLIFLPFVVGVLVLHHVVIPARHQSARKILLLTSSYAFYMSWNPYFGTLLAFSTLLDFSVALRLERSLSARARGLLLCVSLAANLGLLGFFKYGAFFADGALRVFGRELEPGSLPLLELALPIGISFYTFQTLSYTIDVYRGSQRASHSLLDFALYVSFFPQLVAGPIVRAAGLLPQLATDRRVTAADVEMALARIASGLTKKVVFADTLGAYVDSVFAAPLEHSGGDVWLAVYAYAFQIYFDFSGYCDMAIGLGRLFGISLPENFNRPYLATSPRDFWRRWHMTLSTWLRDYLYVSLGGNRTSRTRTQANLMITMLLGGLWHGAAVGFVLWGAYHGALLVLQRVVGERLVRRIAVPLWLRRLLTFHLICLGWILFRAPSLELAGSVLGRMAHIGFEPTPLAVQALVLLLIAAGIHGLSGAGSMVVRTTRWPIVVQGAAYAVLATLVYLASPNTGRFIYFQF